MTDEKNQLQKRINDLLDENARVMRSSGGQFATEDKAQLQKRITDLLDENAKLMRASGGANLGADSLERRVGVLLEEKGQLQRTVERLMQESDEYRKRLAGGAAAVDDKLALERRISLLLDENAQLKLQAGIGDDERGRYERRIAATEDLLTMQLARRDALTDKSIGGTEMEQQLNRALRALRDENEELHKRFRFGTPDKALEAENEQLRKRLREENARLRERGAPLAATDRLSAIVGETTARAETIRSLLDHTSAAAPLADKVANLSSR